MRAGLFATPRPVPGRLLPFLGGALVVLLALPVFLLAGLDVAGWALGAVLWFGLEAIDLVLTRLRERTGNVAASAVLAFGLTFKAVVVLAVLIAAAATHPHLAAAAAIVYVLAYTFQLGISLATYFGTPTS
jgi:heme O synthase-like polyprenyltransferase